MEAADCSGYNGVVRGGKAPRPYSLAPRLISFCLRQDVTCTSWPGHRGRRRRVIYNPAGTSSQESIRKWLKWIKLLICFFVIVDMWAIV